ncbi:MAG: ABC transporter permease [Chloroflexi bacterium]|nr:ABC transporter permease [Chloroflexota bacterium]
MRLATSLQPNGRTWELLYLLTRRDLKLRYQDTALGFVWSLAKPLALGAVLFVALKQFVRIRVDDDYHLVLLTALFPWVWFQTSVLLATPSFSSNGALLTKVPFPRAVLPCSTILNNGVHFLLTIPVLVVLLAIAGHHPSAMWLLGVPVLAAVQLTLLLGVVLFIASINVYFRDLEHLIEVFLTLLFYLSPVFYTFDMVPERWRPLMQVNPLTTLLQAWRELFLNNSFPSIDLWPALVFAAGALALGWGAYRRLEPGFADAL